MFAVHFTPLPTGEGQGVGLFLCLILFVLQVRISRKVGRRDRIIVVLVVYSHAVFCTAFPLPYIRSGGELAETDEVCATIAFHVKLACTLIDDELLGELALFDVATFVAIGTFTKIVDVLNGLLTAATVASTHYSFGIHEVHISQSEERKIGRCTIRSGVGCNLAVVLQVAPLCEKIAVLLVGEVRDVLILLVGEEHIAMVFGAIGKLCSKVSA